MDTGSALDLGYSAISALMMRKYFCFKLGFFIATCASCGMVDALPVLPVFSKDLFIWETESARA